MSALDDHQPFWGFRKELAYGLRDGSLLKIADAVQGAACGCVCPVCGVPLVARKGAILIPHFAHAGSGDGCGVGTETNAHLWAKEELGKALRLRLPAIEAEAAGLSKTVHKGGEFRFAKAELEKHAGDIVPDVLLTAPDGRKLIVEVFVTHVCGPEKIRRIREAGISAIEINLSRWRKSNDPEKIAEALLATAPRLWLYNPVIDATEAVLVKTAAEQARVQAETRRRRAEAEVSQLRRQAMRKAPELEAFRSMLVALGHGRLLTGAQPGDGFAVPARLWKAAALGRLIEEAPGYGALGQVTGDRLLGLIGDCLQRDPRPLRRRLSTQDLKSAVPGYQPPIEALEAFVDVLHDADILYYRKGDLWLSPGVVTRAREFHETRRRDAEIARARQQRHDAIEAQLARLFAMTNSAPESDAFSLARWRRAPPDGRGQSLDQIVGAGGEDWTRVQTGLAAIERMFDGGPPAEVLFGLPFEDALSEAEAQAALIAAEEKAAADAKVLAARQARRAAIRREAGQSLGLDGDTWLYGPCERNPSSRLETAEASDDGLHLIRSALAARVFVVEETRRRAIEVEGFRARLRDAAARVFEPDRVTFFLNNRRGELDWKTPLEHCRDERALADCIRLLPGRKPRR